MGLPKLICLLHQKMGKIHAYFPKRTLPKINPERRLQGMTI
jgi:hypothetical protein